MARGSSFPARHVALMVAACGLLSTAAAQIGPSGNMDDPCYADPSSQACVSFKRADADWTNDLEMLCAAMPYMIGCSLWKQCTSGEALADSPYCSLASLVGDICDADQMDRMKGCEAHNALCNSTTTVVEQCLNPGVAPAVLTTFESKDAIDGVCTSHSMDGCQQCTSVGKTNFRDCPEVLNVLSKLCISMPDMPQCASFKQFCSNAQIAGDFPKVCTQNAADGSSSALPPMKMWFHQGTRDIFLFREWVPNSTGQYIGLCFAMCVLAVFTQLLKAIRLRVEMHWAAQQRAQCVCPEPRCTDSPDSDPETGSAYSTAAKLGPVPDGTMAMRSCCQGNGSLGAAGPPAAPVPTSQRVPFWRSSRRSTLSCLGVDLINKDQAIRNFWRACFTFVVIFLDYALMLVVMTFNVGIILAVCGGFAIGALLFGHAGERPASPAATPSRSAQQVPNEGLEGSSEDLEAVFVEGPGCCSGGTAAAHLSSTA